MISNNQAKQLLYDENPVFFRGIKYKKINGLIFRKTKEKIVASAELLDMNCNSILICPLEWIDAANQTELNKEKKEILLQEEIEVLTIKSQEKMSEMLNLIGQSKAEQAQDSLHELLNKLMKLDNLLIKQTSSFGGLDNGKEN